MDIDPTPSTPSTDGPNSGGNAAAADDADVLMIDESLPNQATPHQQGSGPLAALDPGTASMDIDDASSKCQAASTAGAPSMDVDAIVISSDDDDIIDMTPETPPTVPQTHRQKRSSTMALGPESSARQRPRRVSPNRLAPHNRPVTPTPASSLIPPPDGFFDLYKASAAYRQPVTQVPKLPPGLPPGIRWVAQTLHAQYPQNVTRAQIRDALQEVMDLLQTEPSASLNRAHRMPLTEVSANVRIIMFGLRMCVIAVARLVASSRETEASVAMACHEGHVVTVVATGENNTAIMQPIINDPSQLARFLAADPLLGIPPPAPVLSSMVSWVAQGLNDNTWLHQNRCHYPRAVYILQLVAATNAMHRARVPKFDHTFFPLLQIYSRLGITATPAGHDPMQVHPEYQLLLALKAHGVKNLARFVALIRRMRIASISQPMLHAMMELLAFYRLWKKMFPHIPPPPFTIIWDGDNREPTQDFLEQVQVKWIDIHVHALQAKWTNWICKSTNTRVGTFHTAVRHASESADFEALFQLVANFPTLRFRPLLVVSHDGSFGIMQATHAATMGAMRMTRETLATVSARATPDTPNRVATMVEGVFAHNFGCGPDAFLGNRPEEVGKLLGQQRPPSACGHRHEHAQEQGPAQGQAQASQKKPALPDASRAGWTFWIRSVEDARFWVEWARLCISGYDGGFEKDYYWPGAAFKNISGLFEDGDDE